MDSSKPLPTRSSKYFQMVCINSKNNATKKVPINGPINDLRNNQCSFLITAKIVSKIRRCSSKKSIFGMNNTNS